MITNLLLGLLAVLTLYHSYDDLKNKSVNAVLSILTTLLAILLAYLLGFNMIHFLISCIVLLVLVIIYGFFTVISVGDIVLLPVYVVFFYYIGHKNPVVINVIDGYIVIWFLISLAIASILNYYNYNKAVNEFKKEHNISSQDQISVEIKKKIIKEYYYDIAIPLLPVFTVVMIIMLLYVNFVV